MAKKRRRRIYRRKPRRRRKRDRRLPLLSTLGTVGSFFVGREDKLSIGEHAQKIISGEWALDQNSIMNMLDAGLAQYTGFSINSKDWKVPTALIPIIVGVAGSKLMAKMGFNNQLKKIPLLGKYIKF